MGKLSFVAGMAAGYVLGARAGRQRYEQIARLSSSVWNSDQVQAQVTGAKQAAKTKAAPFVVDKMGDAAHAAADKMRRSKTVTGATVPSVESGGSRTASVGSDADEHRDAWAAATAPTTTD